MSLFKYQKGQRVWTLDDPLFDRKGKVPLLISGVITDSAISFWGSQEYALQTDEDTFIRVRETDCYDSKQTLCNKTEQCLRQQLLDASTEVTEAADELETRKRILQKAQENLTLWVEQCRAGSIDDD